MSQETRKDSFMNVEIAGRLAALRREQGYSQEALAEKLGLSRQAVSKWERAESAPDTGNLVALAKLYGVTLDELLQIDQDIEDDVKFESQDRAQAGEGKAQQAADQAQAAAEQATAAAHLATVVAEKTSTVANQVTDTVSQAAPATKTAPVSPAQPGMVPENFTAEEADLFEKKKKKKGPWLSFPYPVLCVIAFFFLGFYAHAWPSSWLVFLTIPLYYWIANTIENDPLYQERRANKQRVKQKRGE